MPLSHPKVMSLQVPDIARKARIALDLQSKVKAEQSKLSNGTLVTYNIERENIGRVIGLDGSNIRAAKNIPGPYSLTTQGRSHSFYSSLLYRNYSY